MKATPSLLLCACLALAGAAQADTLRIPVG